MIYGAQFRSRLVIYDGPFRCRGIDTKFYDRASRIPSRTVDEIRRFVGMQRSKAIKLLLVCEKVVENWPYNMSVVYMANRFEKRILYGVRKKDIIAHN